MGTERTRGLPARLEALRQRFEHWRGLHKARTRLPQPLWSSAVRMAGTCGLNRTAKALRLDYYALKKRVGEGVAIANPTTEGAAASFFELPPFSSAGACECTVELEDGAAKMRIQVRSLTVPDLASLSQTFWTRQP
jgi:hypothetical protein